MDIAIDVCNGTEDRQCLIDRIMTGKDEVAKNTQNVQIQAQETEATLGKPMKHKHFIKCYACVCTQFSLFYVSSDIKTTVCS